MEFAFENTNFDSIKYVKLQTLKKTLDESLVNLRDVVYEFDHLNIEAENYKKQFLTYKEKCDRNSCSGAEALKKVIAAKDAVIQSVASAVTKLYETKDLEVITEILNIICSESSPSMTPPTGDKLSPVNIMKEPQLSSKSSREHSLKCDCRERDKLTDNKCSNDDLNVTTEVSFTDDSITEIQGTPTGRTSPILHAQAGKKKSPQFGNKKKCPAVWPTPDRTHKVVKLSFPTPSPSRSGKLRQARLLTTLVKRSRVVDLTHSKTAEQQLDKCAPGVGDKQHIHANLEVKRESVDNDETILPSPTSRPADSLLKKTKKKSPNLSLKPKTEPELKVFERDLICKEVFSDITNMEEPTSIIKTTNNNKDSRFYIPLPNYEIPVTRYKQDKLTNDTMKENTPREEERKENVLIKQEPMEEDLGHLDGDSSMSLLQHNMKRSDNVVPVSPIRQPLSDTVNVTNFRADGMSTFKLNTGAADMVALTSRVPAKGATRKQSDRQQRACEQCTHFFGTVYKSDPVQLERKLSAGCGHLRRGLPVPAGFWDVRWSVPTDTEEFNRRNNAL